MVKVLFGMAMRQTTRFVANLLQLINFDRAVPNFSTPPRRKKTPKVNIPRRRWQGPPHLLIDSGAIPNWFSLARFCNRVKHRAFGSVSGTT